MGIVKCFNCGKKCVAVSDSVCPHCGNMLSHVKLSFVEYIGSPYSLNGYQRSYKLVLLKSILEEINERGKANSFAVVSRFRKFYENRIKNGFVADRNVDKKIEFICSSTSSDIFEVIKVNPYNAIKKHGFLNMNREILGGDFVFCDGLDNLTENERNNIIELLDQKLKLYYSKIDAQDALATDAIKEDERTIKEEKNDLQVLSTIDLFRIKKEIEPAKESKEHDLNNNVIVEKSERISIESNAEQRRFRDVKIESLDISNRTYNALKRAQINTVDELIEVMESGKLQFIKHIGVAGEEEIKNAIKNSEKREKQNVQQDAVHEKNRIDEVFSENIFTLFRDYCRSKGIETVDQINEISVDEVINLKGLGQVKVKRLLAKIEEEGLVLGQKNKRKEVYPFKKIHSTNKILSIEILFSFGISRQVIRALNFAGIKTLRDLKKQTETSLLHILDKKRYAYLLEIKEVFEKPLKEVVALNISKHENERGFEFYLDRAEGKTLQIIADENGLTRERVRQICVKFEQEIYVAINIIIQPIIKENKKNYITAEQLSDIFDDDRYDKIVLQLMKNSEDYIYLDFSNIFVAKRKYPNIKKDLEKIAEQIVGEGINIFEKTEEIEETLNERGYSFLDADDFLGLLISLNYKFYNEFVIKNKQSYGLLCANIVAKEFPDGIKINNEEEVKKLRKLCTEKYGDLGLPEDNRPFLTRVCQYLIQSGKGEYTSSENIFIEPATLNEIKQFIDENDRTEIYYKELFQEFEGLLLMTSNIYNAGALHGILLYNYPKEYNYTRDFLIKLNAEKDSRSVAERISDTIFENGKAMSREEILLKLPYLTDISISLAIWNSEDLIQWDTNHFNTSRNIRFEPLEREKIEEMIEVSFNKNKGYCSEGIIYEKMIEKVPEFIKRNDIRNSQNAFYSIGAIFKNDYNFRKPHILRKDWPTDANMIDITKYLMGMPKSFLLTDYHKLAERMKWSKTTAGLTLNELEKEYSRISSDEYMLRTQIDISEADCVYLKNTLNEIPEWYVPASKFMNCGDFTPSGIEINEFSIEEIVKNKGLGWRVISPKVRDRRYQKNVLVKEDCKIKEFDELIATVLKENGYKTISENALLVFMQVNGFAMKYLPKELFNSDYFKVTENGFEIV